jgi:5-methylcytosine-specific restriction endonuclease McrA
MVERTAVRAELLKDRDAHFEAVRKIKRPDWTVKLKAIREYREALLAAQEYRCAYCRMSIALDEVGYRELDHVLPKSLNPVKDFDATAALANDYASRRGHTHGYERFMYEPLNLALACKHCNSTKLSFDGLKDRCMNPLAYPNRPDAYAWVHPHVDPYEKHIERKEGFLYTALTVDQGGHVISACGLDKTEGLNARVLDAMMLHSLEFSDALLKIKVHRDDLIDLGAAARKLYKTFKVTSVQQIETWLRQLRAGRCAQDTVNVLNDVIAKVGTDAAILAQP